jgi:glutamyl-tRNA synthetase
MKIPKSGAFKFKDMLRGEISIDYETVDEQIIIKSDGFPTYHLANVVDDYLMGISHVIRGEEWINSVPKHVLLYEYFGWEQPVFCHLPLLRNPDKSKLSKRKNPTSINYYKRIGIKPEALLNYIGLMGGTMPDDSEMFSLDEFIKKFDISRFSLGGPVFDIEKLRWLNGRYIRETLTSDELLAEMKNWLLGDEYLKKIMPMAQKRLTAFTDFIPLMSFFLSGKLNYSNEFLVIPNKTPTEVKEVLQMASWEVEKVRKWEKDDIYNCFKNISEVLDIKMKHLSQPFYVAISGSKDSTPLFESMELLGRDLSRIRIIEAISNFDEPGISKKAMKKLEKKYKSLF